MKRSSAAGLTANQTDRLIEEFIPETLANGIAVAHNFATDQQMTAIAREASRFRTNFMRNVSAHIATSGQRPWEYSFHGAWPQSFRQSYERYGVNEFLIRASSGTPRVLLPSIVEFGKGLSDATSTYGQTHDIATLRDWEVSRIRLFRYKFPPDPNIPMHHDLESNLRGIRYALGIGLGQLETARHEWPSDTGDLEAFIGYDTAKEVGTQPIGHRMIPQEPRQTLIFDRMQSFR